MTRRQLNIIFLLLFVLFSCDNRESFPAGQGDIRTIDADLKAKLSAQRKYRGVVLTNGEPGGIGFTDLTGMTKLFRSISFTVDNDTTVPIGLQINLSDKPYNFFHTEFAKFDAFLMPDSVTGYGTALKAFLNKRPGGPSLQKKVIYPGEAYTAKIGMLFYTSIGMPDGSAAEEIFFKGVSRDLNRPDTIINLSQTDTSVINLVLGTALHGRSTYYSNISFGQIKFLIPGRRTSSDN